MIGDWDGGVFTTGHEGERQMSLVHWVGKTFHGRDDVDPIITHEPGKARGPSPIMGKATLRMVEFRGQSTATMIYDKHPIFDHFRKIHDDLVMGVMDRKGDAAPLFFKDPEWRDNPSNPDYRPGELPDSTQLPIYTRNQPGLHELFAELRALVDGYSGNRVLLGEFYVPFRELASYYGDRSSPELHLPLNLSWTWSKWRASTIGAAIAGYQANVPGGGWPTTTLDTHDQPRIVARAGIDQARAAAMLLLTVTIRCGPSDRK